MAAGYAWLLGGYGVSTVLSALTFIVVARALGPSNYGLFQAALAYVGLFGSLHLAGFDKVLIRETAADPTAGRALYRPILGLYTMCGLGIVVASLALLPIFALQTASTMVVLIALPIAMLQAFSLAWIAVFNGNSAYRAMTLTDVARQAVYAVLVLALFGLPVDASTKVYLLAGCLVASYVAGFGVRLVVVRRFMDRPLRPSWPKLPWSIWRSGLVLSLFSVLTYLFSKVDILFANAWLSPRDVGLYSVAFNAAARGGSLIMLTGVVLFPTLAASYKRRGRLPGRTLIAGSLLYGSVWSVIGAILWVSGPWVIGVLFGNDYLGAVGSFRLLLVANLVFALGYPLTNYVVATGGEMLLLVPLCVRAVANVGCDWLFLSLGWGIDGIAVATIVASGVFALGLALVYWRRVKNASAVSGPYQTPTAEPSDIEELPDSGTQHS